MRVNTRSEAPIIIRVEQPGGTLRVRYNPQVFRNRLSIFKSFMLPADHFLYNWGELLGEPNAVAGTFPVPMLEPGYYYACQDIDFEARMTGLLTPGLGGNRVGGYLPPYGELELDVRPDQAASQRSSHPPSFVEVAAGASPKRWKRSSPSDVDVAAGADVYLRGLGVGEHVDVVAGIDWSAPS